MSILVFSTRFLGVALFIISSINGLLQAAPAPAKQDKHFYSLTRSADGKVDLKFSLQTLLEEVKDAFSEESLHPDDTMLNKDFLYIAGTITLAAIVYGIVMDQVTARNCIEYFNSDAVPHHKKLVDAISENFIDIRNNPTLIAFIWGVAATWWVGLPTGLLASFVSRAGKLPKLKLGDLKQELALLGAGTALATACAGALGYALHKDIAPQDFVAGVRNFVPAERRAKFYGCSYAHSAAYMAAGISGILLLGLIVKKRIDLFCKQHKTAAANIEKMMREVFPVSF